MINKFFALFFLSCLIFGLTYFLGKRNRSGLFQLRAIVLTTFFILASLLTIFFVKMEHCLYGFDSVGYWRICNDFLDLAFTNPGEVWLRFFQSFNEDLKLLFCPPIMLIELLIGKNRLGFIIAIVWAYAVPAASCFARTTFLFDNDNPPRNLYAKEILPFLIVLLFPFFWIPVVQGYPDVGGMILVFLVIENYFRKPLSDFNWHCSLLLGLLLALSILFRRWYAFWVVSFVIASLVDGFCQFVCSRPKNWQFFWQYIKVPVLSSLAAGIVLLVFSREFFLRAVGTDYSKLLSAYTRHEGGSFLVDWFEWFGGITFLLMGISMVALWLRKGTRRLLFFLVLQIFINIFLIRWGMPSHHISYLIQPSILIIICGGMLTIVDKIPNFKGQVIILVIFALLMGINSFCVFCPMGRDLQKALVPWVPKETYYPRVRSDFPEILQLLDYLKKLPPPQPSIYVLSSSLILDDSQLRNCHLVLGNEYSVERRLLFTSHLDAWGFPGDLFYATHILVADPIQYHLRPSDQKVIGIPAQSLLNGTDIGQGFRRLPVVFYLEKNVRVNLFEKVRPVTEDEFKDFYNKIIEKKDYPER